LEKNTPVIKKMGGRRLRMGSKELISKKSEGKGFHGKKGKAWDLGE